MYIYIYIYIYTCNHENKVPSQLSPQWLCSNSCTSAHDVRLHIYMFSWLHVYYAHLAFVRFEHSVCCGSLMTTYIYIYIYIYILIHIYLLYIYIYILIHIYLLYIYIYIYIYIYTGCTRKNSTKIKCRLICA